MDNATENTGMHTPIAKPANIQKTVGGDWCIEVYEDKNHRALIYGKTRDEAEKLAELFCGAINVPESVNSYSTLKAENEELKQCNERQSITIGGLQSDNEAKETEMKEFTEWLWKIGSCYDPATGYWYDKHDASHVKSFSDLLEIFRDESNSLTTPKQ